MASGLKPKSHVHRELAPIWSAWAWGQGYHPSAGAPRTETRHCEDPGRPMFIGNYTGQIGNKTQPISKVSCAQVPAHAEWPCPAQVLNSHALGDCNLSGYMGTGTPANVLNSIGSNLSRGKLFSMNIGKTFWWTLALYTYRTFVRTHTTCEYWEWHAASNQLHPTSTLATNTKHSWLLQSADLAFQCYETATTERSETHKKIQDTRCVHWWSHREFGTWQGLTWQPGKFPKKKHLGGNIMFKQEKWKTKWRYVFWKDHF